MIEGTRIVEARQRAGLTQQQLAEALGVSLRTVGNWERGETVPRNREHAIRALLAGHFGDSATTPATLREASDAELLAEIARRFARASRREDVMGNAEHPAPIGDHPSAAVSTSVTPPLAPPKTHEGASSTPGTAGHQEGRRGSGRRAGH